MTVTSNLNGYADDNVDDRGNLWR